MEVRGGGKRSWMEEARAGGASWMSELEEEMEEKLEEELAIFDSINVVPFAKIMPALQPEEA